MSLNENKGSVRDEYKRWGLKGDETLIEECYAPNCI